MSMRKLRAAWVVHGPVGFVVIPPRCTLCADLDEEQDVQSVQGCGVDTGEVGRDDAFRLGADELSPRGSGPFGGRVDPRGPQDRPHRRRGNLVAEPAEFAVNASVTPRWVLLPKADCKLECKKLNLSSSL